MLNQENGLEPTLDQGNLEVVTFGCRLNIYESEVIKKLAKDAGLSNKVIVNTCAVTKEAERQAKQTIRRIKRENPNVEIVVTGCSAQISPDQYAQMKEVSRVIGNHEKMEEKTYKHYHTQEKVVLQDIMQVRETANHLLCGFEAKARAFVQIQNGCNHRCTFCTIPYGRGNSRSVPIENIAQQVSLLIDHGYEEIVFTGVDITDYGMDLPGQPRLGQMIRRLFEMVPKFKRLRLSSLDPVEMDDDLWWLIGNESKILPHLHLSLQAGDDLILKRMKRRHLRLDIVNFCIRARTLRPDVVFGADIIAGFPTETDEQFINTKNIIQECDLTFLHIFPYSSRSNTPAARMPQIPKKTIKERAKMLRLEGEKSLERYLENYSNHYALRGVETLIESIHDEHESQSFNLIGRDNYFVPVHISTTGYSSEEIKNMEGKIIHTTITGHSKERLIGKIEKFV